MLKDRSFDILVVSSSDRFNSTISKLIPLCIDSNVSYVEGISLANRLLLERKYDIVIINSQSNFILDTDLAIKLSKEDIGVVLFTDSIDYEEAYYKTFEHGVCTLQRPVETLLFIQSLRVVSSTVDKLNQMKQTNVPFKEKMETIRLVNEAKLLLIRKGLSEEEAHKKIEQDAMNLRITKRKSAELIILELKRQK